MVYAVGTGVATALKVVQRHSPFLVKPEGKTGRVVFSNEKPPPRWQCTLERPVLYYTLYKFRNRRIHWALCIHKTPGFRQIKIRPSQTFPTLQRGSYGSVLKEKMPGKSNQCRHLSWPKVENLKLYLAGTEGLTEPSSTAKLHNLCKAPGMKSS